MHILLPETDNYPSWISRREKWPEKYFKVSLHERMLLYPAVCILLVPECICLILVHAGVCLHIKEDQIHLADFPPVFTRETTVTFVSSVCPSYARSSFWKGIYSKRKKNATLGSQFLPFTVDTFSEGRQKQFDRVSSPKCVTITHMDAVRGSFLCSFDPQHEELYIWTYTYVQPDQSLWWALFG